MKKIFFILLFPLLASYLFANDKISKNINIIGAGYLKAEPKYDGDNYCGISGFDAFSVKATLNLNYQLNEKILLNSFFEISPISIRSGVKASVTPIPILAFSVGSSIGTGWNLLDFDGLKKYNPTKRKYENLTPFKNYYYDFWGSIAFQFDLGEVIKNDWTHIVLYSEYRTMYRGITGLKNNDCWAWQTEQNYTNGVCYDFYNLIGYKMPKKISFVGVFLDCYGYYKDSAFADIYKNFDGNFVNTEFGPISQITFSEKNSLGISMSFATRRAFTTKYKENDERLLLKRDGTELFLNYIGFSFVHKF